MIEVMPSLEAVCGRLFGRPCWIPKVIWGALCFIPVINLFAFGYLLEYARQIRHSSDWDLPDWNQHQFSTLFLNGFRFSYSFWPLSVAPFCSVTCSVCSFWYVLRHARDHCLFSPCCRGLCRPFFFFLLSTSTWKTVSLVKASVSNPLINPLFPSGPGWPFR